MKAKASPGVSTDLTGKRCRATREIRSHQGRVMRSAEGTILYVVENCGRCLFSVAWDHGVTEYAFPFEIEILDVDRAGKP
ncbi:MAG TPA: hypothetical protein VNN77_11340 [candidate division Zixibacteria bacterium]|nr:hypothetical protein [candidate division Zixibacteria bacterium]